MEASSLRNAVCNVFQGTHNSAVEGAGAGDWWIKTHQASPGCSLQDIPLVDRNSVEVDMGRWHRH